MDYAFSCHLESADSVRTNPTKQFADRHLRRLFAEAFVHLIFGERIRSGQVPLFDSHGFVQVVAELVDAKERLDKERSSEAKFASPFYPFVMTHYEKLNDHFFKEPSSVLKETVASRIGAGGKGFELSAMPGIQWNDDLRSRIASVLTRSPTINPDDFELSLKAELEHFPHDFQHLKRLAKVDRYFQRNSSMVEQNKLARKIEWKHTIRASFDHGIVPQDERTVEIVELYKQILDDESVKSRSDVYARTKQRFGDDPKRELANELIDSLYMWNEALIAKAESETTSSGVESDSPEVRELGELISKWADDSKNLNQQQTSVQFQLRPVLQYGPLDNLNPLADASYRAQLLTALADFWIDPDVKSFRDKAWQSLKEKYDASSISLPSKQQYLIEYWQATLNKVREHAQLSSLIEQLSISSNGIVIVRFRNANNLPTHELGMKAPGLTTTDETADEIRESFQKDAQKSESQGSNVPLDSSRG